MHQKNELLPPITTQASKNHILLSLDYCIQIEKKKKPPILNGKEYIQGIFIHPFLLITKMPSQP
jgi:hypothetical protein